MLKKIRNLLIASVLTVVLLLSGVGAAGAADPYNIKLYYNDNIQITYTIKKPSGSVSTGPEDIPIGGARGGALSASQIYCVDPFTPFHSRVPAVGGKFDWDPVYRLMYDEIRGYVAITPGELSDVLRAEIDRVRWIVANGYRGNFLENDQESRDSVERLQKLYSDDDIDKEIALMATKVAIWKVIAGNNVTVVNTTLDGKLTNSGKSKREVFNTLYGNLVADSKMWSVMSDTVPVNNFDIVLNYDDSPPVIDDIYEYYGPLTVRTGITKPNYVDSINDLFLTVSGPDSAEVKFAVSDGLGDFQEITEKGPIYGTNIHDATYINMGGASSQTFYLKVPVSRHPNNGDMLTVRAVARANNVPLLGGGMPVVFVYQSGGIQDWDTIQAFVGWVEGGDNELYADAIVNTGTTSVGRLDIYKKVTSLMPFDYEQLFTFKVYYAYSDHDNPDFETEAQPLSLKDFPVSSTAYSVDLNKNTFTLQLDMVATIQNLPIEKHYYWVEEIGDYGSFSSVYETPVYSISGDVDLEGSLAGPFEIDDTKYEFVVFTNNRTPQPYLRVSKFAVAFNGGAIDNNDLFKFVVEKSDDGSVWDSVDLTGPDCLTGNVTRIDLVHGEFALESSGVAYIKLEEPDKYYRVAEISNSSVRPYASYYLEGVWSPGPEEWTVNWDLNKNFSDMGWLKNKGAGTAAEIKTDNTDRDYDLVFMNVKVPEITISKAVGSGGNRSDVFEFEIYSGDNPVSLTVDPGDVIIYGRDRALLSKITWITGAITDAAGLNNRISGANNNRLLLMDGETASIVNLRPGEYRVKEVPKPGYDTPGFSVISNMGISAGSGAETSPFVFSEEALVDFKNNVPTPTPPPGTPPPSNGGNDWPPDEPNTPNTPSPPDEPNTPPPDIPGVPDGYDEPDHGIADHNIPGEGVITQYGDNLLRAPQTSDDGNANAVIMLVLGMGCVAGAECYRRQRKSL